VTRYGYGRTWILSILHLRHAPCRLTPSTFSLSSVVNLALDRRGRLGVAVLKQWMDCANERTTIWDTC
jgi:hypothetical protein